MMNNIKDDVLEKVHFLSSGVGSAGMNLAKFSAIGAIGLTVAGALYLGGTYLVMNAVTISLQSLLLPVSLSALSAVSAGIGCVGKFFAEKTESFVHDMPDIEIEIKDVNRKDIIQEFKDRAPAALAYCGGIALATIFSMQAGHEITNMVGSNVERYIEEQIHDQCQRPDVSCDIHSHFIQKSSALMQRTV